MTGEIRKFEEGSFLRARRDLLRLVSQWRFRIPATVVTVAFAVGSALLSQNADAGVRIALAIGGVIGGALVLGGLAFLALLLSAPIRQRNELRKAVATESDTDPAAVLRQYSAWVQAVRAALPEYPEHHGPLILMDQGAHDQRAAAHAAALQRYSEAKDEVQRKARWEYHQRFREPLARILGEGQVESAENPQTVQELEDVEQELVRRLVDSPQGPPPDESVNRVMRRVRRVLVNELREDLGILTAALEREAYWPDDGALKSERWAEVGSDLAEHSNGDLHATVSAAYARLAALNQDARDTWSAMEAHYGYDPPPGRPPTIKGNRATLEKAVESITEAERALLAKDAQ